MRYLTKNMFALAQLFGAMPPLFQTSAKDKREMNDRRPYTPPRSMTAEEKVYYDKHKNLNGFYQ